MSAGNLTSVERVKEWLPGSLGTTSDTLLAQLVKNASAFIYNYVNRQFKKQQYDEFYDGHGQTFMVVRQPDIIEVLALSACGQAISKATGDGITNPLTNGFFWDGKRIVLFGRRFPVGRSSVWVSYTAGFCTTETLTVPGTPYQITPSLFWLADEGVTHINGTAFTKVASAPTVGQYAVDASGKYTFAAADASATVVIQYSYCPEDVVTAATEIVAERYKFRDRIGMASKSLGGQETVSFTANQLPQHIKELLNAYQRRIPI